MARFLRNRHDRVSLWLQQEGLCKLCGQQLNKFWQADHIIPYCYSQTTFVELCQATCTKCNLQKGNKLMENTPSMKEYYERANFCKFSTISNLRRGQRGAINCIIDRTKNDHKTTAVVIPTRYGKSHIARISAIELIEQGIVSCACLVAPGILLRDQLVDTKKIKDMIALCLINTTRPLSVSRLESWSVPFQNDEYFESMCTQMLSKNIDQICEWVKFVIKKIGRPPIFYIDEVHTGSEDNSWGRCVKRLTDAGAFVILLTATEERSDGKNIEGFNFITICQNETTKKVPRDHETDESKYLIDTYKVTEATIKLIADYKYSFAEAWAENDVLCRINRIPVNVEYTFPNGEVKFITDFTTNETAKYLGKITRDPKVVRESCKQLVNSIELRRLSKPKAVGLVFCGNDQESEDDNSHLTQVQVLLMSMRPDWKIFIASLKSEEKAAEVIKNFVNGYGDVLIVKQMASLGLDAAIIKTVLDLSCVRQSASLIQRIMRAATPYTDENGTMLIADYITPDDIRGNNLYKKLVTDQGGEMKQVSSELINTEEKDKLESDPPEDDQSKVNRAFLGKITDISEGVAEPEYLAQYIEPLVKAEPKLANFLTHAEISKLGMKMMGGQINSQTDSTAVAVSNVVIDCDAERDKLYHEINETARQIASALVPYNANNKEPWLKIVQKNINRAKTKAGISGQTKLQTIRNIPKLTTMRDFLKSCSNSAS